MNENLAVMLMAAKFGVPVCPHAGGVGLCEYVQHLSMFDYIAVTGTMDGRVIEYVDHLHEHFEDPVVDPPRPLPGAGAARLQHHDPRGVAPRAPVPGRRGLAGADHDVSRMSVPAHRHAQDRRGVSRVTWSAAAFRWRSTTQLAAPSQTPLAQPIDVDGVRVGNRFCILPMEGWDGTRDGEPSDLTRRRWRNFGISGAKLIWGGEAVAVRHDGRANPNQLLMTPRTQPAHRGAARRAGRRASRALRRERRRAISFVGLQLTHSGRYARPDVYDRPAPLAACAHPVLDRRFPNGVRVLEDDELERLVDDFVAAARLARDAGFRFVDVKACHGYLGHELLGARARSGPYGGSLENRTRFMRRVIERIRAEVPGLQVVVRLSVFDMVPYRKRPDGVGEPEPRR